MNEVLVILGSSRSEGYTRKAVTQVLVDVNYELIDLRILNIAPFDYDHQYVKDDHVPVIEKMIHARTIIFATPVYWYAMSSQMKVFFDRFSDLLAIHQDLKEKLRGKRCFLLATGVDTDLPEGFEVPFRRTCDYLDMAYCRSFYLAKGATAAKEDVENFIANFVSGQSSRKRAWSGYLCLMFTTNTLCNVGAQKIWRRQILNELRGM